MLALDSAGLLRALTCMRVSCLWDGQRSQTTASFGVNWPYLEGSFSKTAQTLLLCFEQMRSIGRMDLIPQKSKGQLELKFARPVLPLTCVVVSGSGVKEVILSWL